MSRNKAFRLFWTFFAEVTLGKNNKDYPYLFICSTEVQHKGDHPGFRFNLALWNWWFELNITSSEHDVKNWRDVVSRKEDNEQARSS